MGEQLEKGCFEAGCDVLFDASRSRIDVFRYGYGKCGDIPWGNLTWTNVVSFVSTYEWTNHLTLVSRVDLIGKTTYERAEKAFDGLSCDAQFVESVRYTW